MDSLERPIRILITDDHGVIRGGLRVLLKAEPGFEVVGEASSREECLQLAEELRPDIVLLDISLPDAHGIEITATLMERYPGLRVLILTFHEDEIILREALRAGAAGYITKVAADVELIDAIKVVMRGDIYIHPSLTHMLIKNLTPLPMKRKETAATLSLREVEVLRLIAQGCTNRDVARLLNLSTRTVEGHRAKIMAKLNVRSRVELITFVEEHGLLD